MPVVTVNRSDLFPVGTVVNAYSASTNIGHFDRGPAGASVASGTVAADGSLAVNVPTASVPYVLYAQVGGQHRYLRVTSDDSVTARGLAFGTVNTTSGSATATLASTTAGTFVQGQRLSGAGLPPGTRIKSISGSTLTLSEKATATGTGVVVEGTEGKTVRARLRDRRATAGINDY